MARLYRARRPYRRFAPPPLEPPPGRRLLPADDREPAPEDLILPPDDRDRLLMDGDLLLGRLPTDDDLERDPELDADGGRAEGRLPADGDRVVGEAPVVGGLALGRRTVGPVGCARVEGLPALVPVDGGVTRGRDAPDPEAGERGTNDGRSPPVERVPPDVGAPKMVGRYRFGDSILRTPEFENGELDPVVRLGVVIWRRSITPLVPVVGARPARPLGGRAVLPRLSVARDVGLARFRATSGFKELSRASSGVTSVGDRTETDRKTLPISAEGSAAAGDLVVNGPLRVVATTLPAVGITRSPERARRDRLGLSNSVSGTTVQPRRSTSASRTRPLNSTAR